MDQLIAYFAIFCALVALPAIVLGGSLAGKWLELQKEMLELEREKVRLLAERTRLEAERAASPGARALAAPPDGEDGEG